MAGEIASNYGPFFPAGCFFFLLPVIPGIAVIFLGVYGKPERRKVLIITGLILTVVGITFLRWLGS